MDRITIAGASGFIGKNLLDTFCEKKYEIKALSRKSRHSHHKNVTWKECDLFSLSSTIKALEDTDIAIFLVHSMLPSTRLFQGSFRDTDLIIADNFVRACRKNNIKKIIYLGGIIPDGKISEHLESRKEVEHTLSSSGIDCTVIRAGLVVGNNGSSFEILKNLSLNLPMMILPKWTKCLTQIIYIDDLMRIVDYCISENNHANKVLNAVTEEGLTYKELIELTNKYLAKEKIMIPVPINYTSFSKLWVSIFGHADMSLVSPLIDSLLCDLSEVKPTEELKGLIEYKNYRDMLQNIRKDKVRKTIPKATKQSNNVRSIQRLASDHFFDISKVADYYFEWLPSHVKYLIHVEEVEDMIYFKLRGVTRPLLELKYIKCQANQERVKFHITGGLLTKTQDTGWLEFRNIDHGKYLLASINEFRPALPWYIYKYTQALAHSVVMNNFKRDLLKDLSK